MIKKTFLSAVAAVFVSIAFASQAQAWGGVHYERRTTPFHRGDPLFAVWAERGPGG